MNEKPPVPRLTRDLLRDLVDAHIDDPVFEDFQSRAKAILKQYPPIVPRPAGSKMAHIEASLATRRSNTRQFREKMRPVIAKLNKYGNLDQRQMAHELNKTGYTTQRGKKWSQRSLSYFLATL